MTESQLSFSHEQVSLRAVWGIGRETNRYVTPREVNTRTRCLFFLSDSSDEGGFVPVFDTDLYTEAIAMFDGKVYRFSVFPLPPCHAGCSHPGNRTKFKNRSYRLSYQILSLALGKVRRWRGEPTTVP